MAEKRFENLLNAVLSGDRAKVDRVLEESEFTLSDYIVMPQQFNELPRETKERLARVYTGSCPGRWCNFGSPALD